MKRRFKSPLSPHRAEIVSRVKTEGWVSYKSCVFKKKKIKKDLLKLKCIIFRVRFFWKSNWIIKWCINRLIIFNVKWTFNKKRDQMLQNNNSNWALKCFFTQNVTHQNPFFFFSHLIFKRNFSELWIHFLAFHALYNALCWRFDEFECFLHGNSICRVILSSHSLIKNVFLFFSVQQ